MTYDSQYLGQNLTNRAKRATHDFAVEMVQITSKMASNGTLNSSMTFQQFWQAGLKVLDREARDACQFVYNLTGEHSGEALNQVSFCVERMVENMMLAVTEKSGRAGALGGVYAEIVNRMHVEMEEKRDAILADFKNGMMGSERLRKDPVVNIVANQTNSPGSVQQIGVGNVSQSAVAEQRNVLKEVVAKALKSAEYEALSHENKSAFKDVADVLVAETEKKEPDGGKIMRWGTHLVNLSKELSLHVAAHEIAQVLHKMLSV